jgi:hypothetical protein
VAGCDPGFAVRIKPGIDMPYTETVTARGTPRRRVLMHYAPAVTSFPPYRLRIHNLNVSAFAASPDQM